MQLSIVHCILAGILSLPGMVTVNSMDSYFASKKKKKQTSLPSVPRVGLYVSLESQPAVPHCIRLFPQKVAGSLLLVGTPSVVSFHAAGKMPKELFLPCTSSMISPSSS